MSKRVRESIELSGEVRDRLRQVMGRMLQGMRLLMRSAQSCAARMWTGRLQPEGEEDVVDLDTSCEEEYVGTPPPAVIEV